MELVDIEKYFVDYLQGEAEFADLDTSPQSNFHDLVIKPNLVLAKAVFGYVNYVRIGSSLDNFSYMDETQLDNLAANYFVYRKGSSNVFTEITIYFADNSLSSQILQVVPTDTFSTSDGIIFNTTQDYIFIPSALPLTQVNNVLYRVAVFPVVSQNATRIVSANEIVTVSISHPSITSVTNLTASSAPVAAETNSQLKSRMLNGMATRNLTSRSSFSITLSETFPIITDVHTLGFGDPEMQRDIAIAGQYWSYHAGGMIDCYVRTPLKPVTFQVTGQKLPNQNVYRVYLKRYKGYDVSGSDKSNPHPSLLFGWEKVTLPDTLYMAGATVLPELPLMYFDWSRPFSAVSVSDNSQVLLFEDLELTADTFEPRAEIRSIEESDITQRFSAYEQLYIDFFFTKNVGDFATFTIPYWTTDSLESVQQFVSNEANRFQCSNTIVKSFIPVEIVKLAIVYDKNYTFDTVTLATTIADYINAWTLPEPIRLTELLKMVPVPVRLSESGKDFSNLDSVKVDQTFAFPPSYLALYNGPTFVETKQYNIDDSSIHFYSTRQIALVENSTLSATNRTVRYYVDPSRISFIPHSW